MVEKCWRRMVEAFRAELGSSLREWASVRIVDYVVGLHYTYVMLKGGWCGVAATPYWLEGLEPVRLDEPFTAQTAARKALEGSPLALSLLIAAANAATNALIDSRVTPWVRVGSPSRLLLGWGVRRVLMVGFMEGLAGELRSSGVEVLVVEYDRRLVAGARARGYTVLGGVEAEEAASKVDAVVVSGSALLEPCKALELSSTAPRSLVVGFTSSFHPRIAGRLGFDAIGGAFVEWRVCPLLRRAVALGGGPRTVRKWYGVRLAKWYAETGSVRGV